MDFTKGMFHEAETRIEADAWLGHIVCIVPDEVDVAVMAEVTAGDVSVADRHVSGLGHRVLWRSPHDVQARARLRIHIRCVIGTVRVQVRP
jgi:lia operon protein LiaF